METIASLILIAVAYCVFTKTKDTKHKGTAVLAFATVITLSVMITNVTAVPLIAAVLVGIFYFVGSNDRNSETSRNVMFYTFLIAAAGIVYYPQFLLLF